MLEERFPGGGGAYVRGGYGIYLLRTQMSLLI